MSEEMKQEQLTTVMNDIINFRSDPPSDIERFNIVLYSLKGFKKNEPTVDFIERLITELTIVVPLPKLTIDPFLDKVAQKLLNASEKMKINPDKFTKEEIENIVKPLIKNYDHISIIYDTHNNASKFLTKIVLKEDVRGTGFDSPNVKNLFELNTDQLQNQFIGSAGRQIGRTGHYLVVMIDDYEKVVKRNDITEEEYREFKHVFNLFDENNDGVILPKEFETIISKPGIKISWPSIVKFQKILFKDPNIGVQLEEFIDAGIKFGIFDHDDVIRRIFDLYCDDTDNDTLSLLGLKRMVNEHEVEPHKGDVNLLFKFAVDKTANVTFVEFRDFVRKGIKAGTIKLPSKVNQL
jgi:Ca2+-binding EF-hand superfamily protein